MSRPLRLYLPDAAYHVTSRGLERRAIVRDEADRRKWVDLLGLVATRRDWRVFAWALMDNHCHLFLRAPHADLSAGMHDLNAGYVSWFNRRRRRHGPLLQGRFKAILVEPGTHEWELSRYVHLNPVRAGLVQRPEQYHWGSCAAYANERLAPAWLAWEEVLSRHGSSVKAARRGYWRYLEEGLASPPASPLTGAAAGMGLGSPGFLARARALAAKLTRDRDVPAARALRPRPSIEDIEGAVLAAYAASATALRRRWQRGNEARQAAMALGCRVGLVSARELGARYGVTGQLVSWTVRGVEARRRRDPRFDERLRAVEAALMRDRPR